MLAVEGSSEIQGQQKQRFLGIILPLYNCECFLIGRVKEFGRGENNGSKFYFYFHFDCFCCNRWIILVFDLYFGRLDMAMKAIDPSV